jgi:hypothetical protein
LPNVALNVLNVLLHPKTALRFPQIAIFFSNNKALHLFRIGIACCFCALISTECTFIKKNFVPELFRKASSLESTVIISGLLKKLVAVGDS